MKATLTPPSRPVAPGSYDFRRDLFFDGVGGIGFGYGRVGVQPADGEAIQRRFWQAFAGLRATIEGRILAAIPDRAVAGITVAFVTGSQTAVPKDALGAMRDSGLAHLLSVSGLHVGLVAGILFFLSRAALALVPAVALRWPIKKWAAGLALAGAVFYTLLSGASVPVVRACLMAGVALVAIIFDRQPISMRPIAWAAIAVLLLWPESLMGPSFQLSFGAIIGLAAMWEELAPRRRRQTSPLRRGVAGLRDMVLTSLIATVATAAFAIYHFNRFTGYGVIANMLAIPITGSWVMPFLIIALLLMPFGLESLALEPAGWGISAILWTARTVAGLPAPSPRSAPCRRRGSRSSAWAGCGSAFGAGPGALPVSPPSPPALPPCCWSGRPTSWYRRMQGWWPSPRRTDRSGCHPSASAASPARNGCAGRARTARSPGASPRARARVLPAMARTAAIAWAVARSPS